MPTYTYVCAACGAFDALRPMASRDQACACPGCRGAAHRIIDGAPTLRALSQAKRAAHETNERSAHAPRRSAGPQGAYASRDTERQASSHAPGCQCASHRGAKSGGAGDAKPRLAQGRPWMISH